MYIYLNVHVYVYIFTNVHLYIYIPIFLHMCSIHMHTSMHMYKWLCFHAYHVNIDPTGPAFFRGQDDQPDVFGEALQCLHAQISREMLFHEWLNRQACMLHTYCSL